MTRHRLRQGNLMGPAGFLGLEDNEAMKFVQDGLRKSRPSAAVIELGGEEEGTAQSLITESAIRALYRHWRGEMGL
ncbi:MAG: salicylate hydroxylase, partial [Stellaceae bacterium]